MSDLYFYFTSRLPPLRCLPVNSDVILCHAINLSQSAGNSCGQLEARGRRESATDAHDVCFPSKENIMFYYMACVYSQCNARSDWPIVGYDSCVMPTGRLRACKTKAKNHIINNLLTWNVRSLRENLYGKGFRFEIFQ